MIWRGKEAQRGGLVFSFVNLRLLFFLGGILEFWRGGAVAERQRGPFHSIRG